MVIIGDMNEPETDEVFEAGRRLLEWSAREGFGVEATVTRTPPDLLPLILLELMLLRGSMENRDMGVYERWRRQMKRLGHWDERYE